MAAIAKTAHNRLGRTVATVAAHITSAYVSNNHVPIGKIGDLIIDVHNAVQRLVGGLSRLRTPDMPAVPISESITEDYLICLEDGRRCRMMKSHLRLNYDMTPTEYRRKWKLPSNYPMSAPSYSAIRAAQAKKQGLGIQIAPEDNKGRFTVRKRATPSK